MKTKYKKNGYSAETANEYVNGKAAIYSLSTELEPQFKYVEKRRTDEVIGYKAWFTQEGLPPFVVKFENQVSLPNYLAVIAFNGLQACEVGYDVYFKAEDIKEVR